MTKNLKFMICLGVSALGWVMMTPAQTSKQGIVKPLSAVKFERDADVQCLRSAAENGDPDKGPSTYILQAPAKCAVPWHYHTAEEQLIVIRGAVLTEMEGMSRTLLGPGGFAMMPSKKIHRFSCSSNGECLIVVTFDRPYDIFWVKK